MELLGYVDIDFENKENFKIIKKDVVILEDEYKMINNYIFDNIASTNEITLYEIYDYLDRNYINNVKKKVQEVLDRKMDEYIYKLQKEYNVDLAELYRYSRKNFLTAKEYNDYNFKEKFKDAKINVKLDITFNDSGLNLEK